MSRTIFIASLVSTLLFFSCSKIEYFEDDPITFHHSKMIAHRGGRTFNIRENTLEGIARALPLVDGIEIDVQLSKDRTVWLSHSSIVEGCEKSHSCFSETTDAEIRGISWCNGKDISYTSLEEVMNYMDNNNFRKFIVIDMKGWIPCSAHSLNIESLMRIEVERIISLSKKYDLEDYIIIENVLPSILKFAKRKSNRAKTFLISYGDFEKAMLQVLSDDFDGIAFKTHSVDEITSENIEILHRKGIRFMAWNVPDSGYVKYLQSIHVDFIQIDLK